MADKISLLFLWHMHQPYYKDTIKDQYVMPWVRLHATKGYYDIPLAMEKYGISGCINVVPCLLEQIEDYVNNNAEDSWKIYTEKHPDDMTNDEKGFVLENFFMLNWDRLIFTSKRYAELLNKREEYLKRKSFVEMAPYFSSADIMDIQVLFNLKWFGFMAREHNPFLRLLDEKDRFFTNIDKMELLRIQRKILIDIIPLYRRLQREGKIEISFTPFYHPIFPLVYDTDISRRSAPTAPMPSRFSYPEDALWHVREGKKYAEKIWEKEITGMWPAEGSVCPEIVPAVADAGVKWIAADDGILFRSIGNSDKNRVLYKPYKVKSADREVITFFRDKYLSDLIGFSFAKMEADKAADIFVNYIRSAKENSWDPFNESVISVILDGENAWESYPNNGRDFIFALFQKLSASPDIKTETMDSYLSRHDSSKFPVIERLYSGSWINSDYMIWIGNMQDNTAWNYLKRVREFWDSWQRSNPEIDSLTKQEVMRSLYRAEGSDWFWWYGDSFSSQNDYLFDRLFRRHLRKVFKLLGEESPTYLDMPISSLKKVDILREPTGFITPAIEGKCDSFYDWRGAGLYDSAVKPGSSMYNSNKILEKFHYGFDREFLYFKITFFDSFHTDENDKYAIKFFIIDNVELDFSLPLRKFEKLPFTITLSSDLGRFYELIDAGKAVYEDVLELNLNYKKLGLKPSEKISVYLKIFTGDGTEIERIPDMGMIDITIPDKNYLVRMWDV